MNELIDVYCMDIKFNNAKEQGLNRVKIIDLSDKLNSGFSQSIDKNYLFENAQILPYIQYLNLRNKARITTYFELKTKSFDGNSQVMNDLEEKLKKNIEGLDFDMSIKKEFEGDLRDNFFYNSFNSYSSKIKLPASKIIDFDGIEKSKILIGSLGALLAVIIAYSTIKKYF